MVRGEHGVVRYDGSNWTEYPLGSPLLESIRPATGEDRITDMFLDQDDDLVLRAGTSLLRLNEGHWEVMARNLGFSRFGNLIDQTANGWFWTTVEEGGTLVRIERSPQLVVSLLDMPADSLGGFLIDQAENIWFVGLEGQPQNIFRAPL